MSKAPASQPRGPEQLDREAAQWFARMRGPGAEAARPGFEAWLAQGPAQRSAYNRAAEIFAMGKLLAEDAATPPRTHATGRTLALAAGALSLLAAGGWIVMQPTPLNQTPGIAGEAETIATRAGETRTLRLADGSSLALGEASSVALRFDPAGRQLRLLRGRARFDVAHERRPFTVFAGGGSVTARGTVFEVVLTRERRVEVHLIEGAVDVAPPRRQRDAAVVRQLRRGERMSFESGVAAPQPAAAISPSPTAAAHDYQAVRVAVLVAQANLGARRPIRVADPVLGECRLSGHFRIDDTALLARRIAAVLGVRAIENDREILLTR